MTMTGRIAVFVLLISICVPKISRAQFSMESYLATARDDISLSPTRAKQDFLNDNNYNGPWISRVEFRTRSNDANLSQEDFRFRITPANPSELKANKRYYSKQVELLNFEYREELNNALLERYEIAVDHLFEFRSKNDLIKQMEINRQLIDMINQSTGAYNMDLGDLVDAESDDLEMKLKIEDTNIRIEELEFMIRDFYSYSGSLDWNSIDLISVDDILTLFEEFKGKQTGEHINLVKMDQRNALAAERFNIEKSESLRNIGYFQAEYDTDRGDEASEHFGYQIGIRIPIVNPDKPDLNRRKLALMDDQALLEEKKDSYRREMELAVIRMEHYHIQYNQISEKLETMSQRNFIELNNPGRALRVSDLIKINEFYLELLSKKNSIEKNIFETYLDYLNLNGILSELPLRNYLSKDLSEF